MNITQSQYLGQIVGPIEIPMTEDPWLTYPKLDYPGKWIPQWEAPLDPRTPGISPTEATPQPTTLYNKAGDEVAPDTRGRGIAVVGVTIAVLAATAFLASR